MAYRCVRAQALNPGSQAVVCVLGGRSDDLRTPPPRLSPPSAGCKKAPELLPVLSGKALRELVQMGRVLPHLPHLATCANGPQTSGPSKARMARFLAKNLETPGSSPNLEQTTRALSFPIRKHCGPTCRQLLWGQQGSLSHSVLGERREAESMGPGRARKRGVRGVSEGLQGRGTKQG